jgi:hypothetical protein
MADLVPSTRLNDEYIDSRKSGRYPIARSTVITVVVADGTSLKLDTGIKVPHGLLIERVVSAPNIPTDVVFDLRLLDSDGVELIDWTGISDNQVTRTKMDTSAVATRVFIDSSLQVEVDFVTELSGDTATFDIVLKVADPFGM